MKKPAQEEINLKAYWGLLREHDWQYNYSDNGRIWNAGKDNEQKLLKIARSSRKHMKLFLAWERWAMKPTNKPMPKEPK